MRIALRFIEGSLAGHTVMADIFQGKHCLVGRDASSTIRLGDADRAASTSHAKFVLEGNDVTVNDIGSTYGTYINQKAMARARLKGGEQIRFGVKGPLAEFLIVTGPAAQGPLPPPPKLAPPATTAPMAVAAPAPR